ncbi:PREDICTED: suppressor of IKBKE 1 [Dipodomys ordii]|uniref:Suppressor of IKBKE 1 n=1 Tax=Dipodomys ordii TaxID=10020 RepID=A0A1S3FU42_DIPOR|nr:PREDICTED: suppressor of IKBKE 1 [Dipodomys ordii]
MSCTIEKILTDAKTLLERLREHDAAAESLVDQSAALHRRVAAMREAGSSLPDQVLVSSFQGRQSKYLHNAELWISLEEHQDALELIMSKYRKQMLQLMVAKKAVDTGPVLRAHQSHSAFQLENKELRELLSISSESLQIRGENSVDPAS